MKGKVKKNQLIIVALAVMIAAAGYLNYTGRLFGENAKVMILKQKEHLERRFSQMVQPRLR